MSSYRENAHRSRLANPSCEENSRLIAETIDAHGLKCPEPVMLLHNAIRKAPAEGHVLLTATDPSTQRDVPQFCKFLEHQLVESTVDDVEGIYTFLIRKRVS